MPEFAWPGQGAPKRPSQAELDELARSMDIIARQAAALPARYLHRFLPVLEATRADLRNALRDWLRNVPDGELRFTAQQYRVALRQIHGAMESINARLPLGMKLALEEGATASGMLAITHLDDEIARFGAVFGQSMRPIQLEQSAILASGKKALIPRIRTSSARYGKMINDDIQRQLAIGVLRGESFHQLTNRLVKLGGPSGLVSLRGVLGEPGSVAEYISEGLFRRYRGWADRVVSTEVLNAYNVHHHDGLTQLETDDPGWSKRWDATIDRTCIVCRDLDGVVVKIEENFPGGFRHPPAHPRCRCALTPWRKEWAE